MIKADIKNIANFIPEASIESIIPEIERSHSLLESGKGEGNEFLGWLRLPKNYDRAEFERVKQAAAKIASDSRVLLVIGIGGSYLGARAVIEFLRSPNYNLKEKSTPDIFFAGNNLSPSYCEEIIELIGDRDFSINVISKSGTTIETAIAFRIFKSLLEKRYGKEAARRRIYATTDKTYGVLRSLSDAEHYETFIIPDDVGGRFSVLTPVGLLPIACAGIDIDALLDGAAEESEALAVKSPSNPAWQYAAARNLLYRRGKVIEILACYEPSFRFMAEWWKQLFGESEGKDLKGIFPASIDLTADLHSLGQYVQDGTRNIFETVVSIDNPGGSIRICEDEKDLDGLGYLAGRELSYVNNRAFLGTLMAHVDGGVPNIILTMPARDEKSLGALIYFFELSCGISGYTLGVNPFNQHGVEAYKSNMFALLGKPGYEELSKKLEERLGL